MAHSPIHLDDARVRALERVAAEQRLSLDEVLRNAVDAYLEGCARAARPWEERFADVVGRFRAGVPADMTPDEIEAEITANWEEYRAEQATARDTAARPGDAGSR